MTLRNSMLAFVVSADDQNKSPEDWKSYYICSYTFFNISIYIVCWRECHMFYLSSSSFSPYPNFLCVCIPEVLCFECKIKSNNTEKPMGKNWFINEKVAFILELLLET